MAVRARADEAYVCIYMEIWENGKKYHQMIFARSLRKLVPVQA